MAKVKPSTFGIAYPIDADLERKTYAIYQHKYQLSHEELVQLSQGQMPSGLLAWNCEQARVQG